MKKILATLFIAAALLTACTEKEDNGNNNNQNQEPTIVSLAGTSWIGTVTNDPEEFRQREKKFNENYKRLFYRDIDISEKDPIECMYTIGALAQNPDIADWYVSSSLLEPLLNINPSIVNRDNKKMVDTQNVHHF